MTSEDRTRDLVEALDPSALGALFGRSMLLTSEWSRAELESLCALAEGFEALDRAGIATPLFRNELNLAVFFDSSTRTKSSWAGAAARLGASPVVLDGSSTQVSHGETAEETGTMLGMNAHALGIRHDLILGEGNSVHAPREEAGIDEYLRLQGSDPRWCRSSISSATSTIRPRPSPTTELAARVLPRRHRGSQDRRHDLGLLAELRQAAVGAPGADQLCCLASACTCASSGAPRGLRSPIGLHGDSAALRRRVGRQLRPGWKR